LCNTNHQNATQKAVKTALFWWGFRVGGWFEEH